MRTWFWPVSWYFRIRELEARVAALTEQNMRLDAQLRASAIQQASLSAAYASALASMAATVGVGPL